MSNENKMIDGELLFNELIHLIKMLKSRKGKWDEEKDGVYLLSMLFSNVITIMSLVRWKNMKRLRMMNIPNGVGI